MTRCELIIMYLIAPLLLAIVGLVSLEQKNIGGMFCVSLLIVMWLPSAIGFIVLKLMGVYDRRFR